MPVYDYQCSDCGRTIEVMHGVHAHGPKSCEVCGGAMRKVLSPPAIVFKGSGWAKKDARASTSSHSSPRSGSAKSGTSGSGAGASGAGGDSGGASKDGAAGGTSGPSPAD